LAEAREVTLPMTTLHFLDPQTGLLDRLADLMIRRRVCVTRGDIELANGAALRR